MYALCEKRELALRILSVPNDLTNMFFVLVPLPVFAWMPSGLSAHFDPAWRAFVERTRPEFPTYVACIN